MVAPVGLETALKEVGATMLFRSNSEVNYSCSYYEFKLYLSLFFQAFCSLVANKQLILSVTVFFFCLLLKNDLRKMTEEDKNEPLAPRKAWGDIPFQPRILPLEVTASAMEGKQMI